MNELYEPMLSREIDRIPEKVRELRRETSSEELFRAITRFALLSASPSQHGKHALLACVVAGEVQNALAERFDELLSECAIYAAQSRLPWSEPPITDPPDVEENHPAGLDEIRGAIQERDRLRGERWLAARLRLGDLARDFFTIAAEDLSDFGHKLIVAVAVWKLSLTFQQADAYPFLRVAIGEWTAYSEPPESGVEAPESASVPLQKHVEELFRRCADDFVAQNGSLEAFHRLVVLDAAIDAARFAAEDQILHRVVSQIEADNLTSGDGPSGDAELPVYRLARDYAEYLKAFALVRRRGRWMNISRVLAAAKYNRDHSSSFEEWSFA